MQSTMSRRTLEEMATRRDRSGSLWLVQAFSGLLLVFILGAHMIAHHFIVEGGLRDYEPVSYTHLDVYKRQEHHPASYRPRLI